MTLRDRIEVEARTSEVVWLNNGDRLEGSFLGMDERNIKLEVDRKPLEIDRGGAVGVGFDPKLLNYPRPEGAFLEATLGDGTRLGLTATKLVEGNIEATTRFGRPVRFPLTELARLHARSSSVAYLSERQPARRAATSPMSGRRVPTASIGPLTASRSGSADRLMTAGSGRRAGPCWLIASSREIVASSRSSASTSERGRSGAWSSGSSWIARNVQVSTHDGPRSAQGAGHRPGRR